MPRVETIDEKGKRVVVTIMRSIVPTSTLDGRSSLPGLEEIRADDGEPLSRDGDGAFVGQWTGRRLIAK